MPQFVRITHDVKARMRSFSISGALIWLKRPFRGPNGGAAGVDGQTFEQIEAQGVEAWLEELAKELKTRTYRHGGRAAGLYPEAGWEAAALGYHQPI
jgi:hypothetical protein